MARQKSTASEIMAIIPSLTAAQQQSIKMVALNFQGVASEDDLPAPSSKKTVKPAKTEKTPAKKASAKESEGITHKEIMNFNIENIDSLRDLFASAFSDDERMKLTASRNDAYFVKYVKRNFLEDFSADDLADVAKVKELGEFFFNVAEYTAEIGPRAKREFLLNHIYAAILVHTALVKGETLDDLIQEVLEGEDEYQVDEDDNDVAAQQIIAYAIGGVVFSNDEDEDAEEEEEEEEEGEDEEDPFEVDEKPAKRRSARA